MGCAHGGGTHIAGTVPIWGSRPKNTFYRQAKMGYERNKTSPRPDESVLSASQGSSGISHPANVGVSAPVYLNWFLVVIVVVLLAFAVLTTVPPLVSERLAEQWPWPKTPLILMVVLSLALITLVGLWHQHRYITLLRTAFEWSQKDLADRAERNKARVYALLNVSKMLGSHADLQTIFDTITETCVDTFHSHQASLMVFDKDSQELIVRAARGKDVDPNMLGVRQPLGKGIAGVVAERGEALLLGAMAAKKYPDLKLKMPQLNGAMVVPIMLRDSLVGVINVSTKSRTIEYDEDDLRALQVFAENVGICIRHMEQADWMRQTIHNLQEQLQKVTT